MSPCKQSFSPTQTKQQLKRVLEITLLDYLTTSLSTFPNSHNYKLQILKSKQRRSHSLFPHSSVKIQNKLKIYQEEILIILSESLDLPSSSSSEGVADDSAVVEKKAYLPILALEANIYTIPTTSTSIIYISKVDTSGLPSPLSPSPAKTLISSYISYNLQNPPHETKRLRIHIFAKSQSQYLFPGSIENKGKKVLDDKGLLRWWKSTLSAASEDALKNGKDRVLPEIQQYYFVPGLTESESLPYVPPPPPTSSSSTSIATPWIYSHAFSLTCSPLYLPSSSSNTTPILTDLIPAFPDDPKSRFLHSLSSSSISCSGAKDDYDDLHLSLSSTSFTVGHGILNKLEEVEKERDRERKRLCEGIEGGVEEWWERLAFRQECCSGVLVGFFAVVRDDIYHEEKEGEEEEWSGKKTKNELGSLDNKIFISLWSQFHNVDYAWTNITKMIEATSKWQGDLERLISAEGFVEGEDSLSEEILKKKRKEVYQKEVKRDFEVRNQGLEKRKREVVEEKVVNVMVPRKKKPKVVV